MRSIVHGRTVIIIAHRLAAVRPCTRIVGMHRGEIVEVGSHEELLARERRSLRASMGAAVRPGEGDGMNDRAVPPAATSLRRPPPVTVTGRDREFLPAALEILETPPPPFRSR